MPQQHPNILLFVTDQHRLSALGCYGDTICRTPNIDRLAAQGVRFETAYTTCPVCSPARGTIMTGQYPHSHGITANLHELSNATHELQDRPDLLSRRLQTAGYRLGYTGKWHLGTERSTTFGFPNRPSLPPDVGFEGQSFPGHGGGGFHYPEYHQYLADNALQHSPMEWDEDTPMLRNAAILDEPVEATVPYFLAENTISLLDRFSAGHRPFFIWHNNWGPHEPYFATRAYVDMYRDVEIPPWPNYGWPSRQIPGPHQMKIHPRHERLSWDAWAAMVRYYYAFTSMIDDQIGRVLAHLEATGLAQDTLVIFTSDHGETLGSHGGLTDKGWHHFEETHRVGLIARGPGIAQPGQVRQELVSLADVYPTLCDAAGASHDAATVHGRSIMPLLRDEPTDWRDCVVTEFGGLGNMGMTQRTLRCGSMKYGYNCCGDDELYDLNADPHETRNLIHDHRHRGTVGDMRDRLLSWIDQTGDPIEFMYQQTRIQPYRDELGPQV